MIRPRWRFELVFGGHKTGPLGVHTRNALRPGHFARHVPSGTRSTGGAGKLRLPGATLPGKTSDPQRLAGHPGGLATGSSALGICAARGPGASQGRRVTGGFYTMTYSASGWEHIFRDWPAEIPRRGILVTTFGEQIAFGGFLTGGEFLYVERQTPDSLGARSLVVPYGQIAAVKFTDVVKSKLLRSVGFEAAAK